MLTRTTGGARAPELPREPHEGGRVEVMRPRGPALDGRRLEAAHRHLARRLIGPRIHEDQQRGLAGVGRELRGQLVLAR